MKTGSGIMLAAVWYQAFAGLLSLDVTVRWTIVELLLATFLTVIVIGIDLKRN